MTPGISTAGALIGGAACDTPELLLLSLEPSPLTTAVFMIVRPGGAVTLTRTSTKSAGPPGAMLAV
jgi:hypothetical protein